MYISSPFSFLMINILRLISLFLCTENNRYKLYGRVEGVSQKAYHGYGCRVHSEYVRFEYGGNSSIVHHPFPFSIPLTKSPQLVHPTTSGSKTVSSNGRTSPSIFENVLISRLGRISRRRRGLRGSFWWIWRWRRRWFGRRWAWAWERVVSDREGKSEEEVS